MRKLLSVIISLIIVFMSVSNGLIAFASELSDNGLNSFAEDLISMIRQHEFESTSDTTESVTSQQFYSSSSSADKYSDLPKNAFVARRLIVKSERKIDYQGAIDCVSGYRDLYILQYDTVLATQNAYDYYLTLDYIDYVEPDLIMKMQEDISDKIDGVIDDVKDYIDSEDDEDNNVGDTAYEIVDKVESWVSETNGFDDIKEELAEHVEDDYIQVAVLDSGVDTDHEIFEDRLIENNINFSSSGDENSVEDDYGHGTHVAGIIVDNTLSNVKIKPYKVLNNKGNGSESLIAIAIDLAVAEGADIINMSLASEGECQTMTDSINNAVENDVNVVVAAGNNKTDLSLSYISPACIEAAFTVSATTESNTLASYSNYNGTIDIAAPGDNVKSSYLNNSYIKLSGTSMAAPQVTAGLAVIYTAFPDKTAKEAEEMLCEYAIKLNENEGENKFGAGLLYLKYILEGMPTTADPIFSVDSCTFSNSFTLTITCPEKNATILYVIKSDEDDDGDSDIDVNYLNGTVYKKALTVSLDTKIYAVAYVSGKKFSSVVKKKYIRANNSEADLYDINNSGYITAYFGDEIDLIIPKVIRGKTIKGIANGAFKNDENIRSVTLPSTVTRIFNEAFMNCTALETITGEGVTQIEQNAFANSSVSEVNLPSLTTVGISAFENCTNLESITLSNVVTFGNYAFKNATGVSVLSSDKVTTIGTGAFSGTQLQEVNLPNLSSLGSGAFKDCSELTKVSVPYVKSVLSNTFQNCVNLKEIDIPLAESIGANSFRNTGIEYMVCDNVTTIGNYAFADNSSMAYAWLPNTTSIGTYAFSNCPELQVVHAPLLVTLKGETFSDCPKLLVLWLPSVETVNTNALDNSSVEYLQLDKVQTINSLPATLIGLTVPTSLTSIKGTIPDTDFTVYGYEGTYAEQFAIENNKQFQTVPNIVYELDDKVDIENKYIIVYAMGFNCTYQWYKNDTLSNENGTLIDGATNYYYEPVRSDDATSYYCVITSDDGVNFRSITTKYVENAYEYRSADFTEYNEAYDEYMALDRSIYKESSLEKLDELFSIDVSGLTLAQQDILDSHVDKILNAIETAELNYVLYDINNDGKISILDARLALKAVVGSYSLNKTQTLAADVNCDGKVSIIDSRAILKNVIGN